ncbi:hypothetical protein LCGC14_2425540, partial [marine sediment metagenome]
AKYRAEIEQREAWGDKTSPDYIEDDDLRQDAYDKQFEDNPEFREEILKTFKQGAPAA